jgi:predicted dehydrogenase
MTASPLRVGVFGVGSLGQHHARIYGELPEVELTGVFDADPARASEIADRLQTRAFGSIEELAAAVEAASVVVPTSRHLEVFRTLAVHGVHQLMEKPIAARTEEAEAMVREAREHNLVLQVGHIERFNPVMRFLEERLRTPRFIEALRMGPYPPQRPGLPPRNTEVSVVLDLMIHDLEIILHLVRSPVEDIRAFGAAPISAEEDLADVRLRFANGCVANLTASRISADPIRNITVFQDDGYLSLDYMTQQGRYHRVTRTGMEVESVPVERQDALTLELRHFTECVRTRGTPAVTGEQASEALRLAVDICEVIRTRPC